MTTPRQRVLEDMQFARPGTKSTESACRRTGTIGQAYLSSDPCQPGGRHILHIRLAAVQCGHLAIVHVDADHRDAPLSERDG